MRVDAFDFDLPEETIALRPASPRDQARMLIVKPHENQKFADHQVSDLEHFLQPGDALVMNDTKVIPAQLHARRKRGAAVAKILITLHMRTGPARWRAFARPAKKIMTGEVLLFDGLAAKIEEKGKDGEVVLDFSERGSALDARIAELGEIPLPPYIASKRLGDARDYEDYQTVYACNPGAVAAPTAGLHITKRQLQQLHKKGISTHYLTLHVGAGTFLPVKAEDTNNHKMYAELGEISAKSAAALNEVKQKGRRVVAVGTTTLRLLESAADKKGVLHPFCGETNLFITPGYEFKVVDLLITNFHLPRSTLFMLVSAFCGLELMHQAYAHAMENGYRFYSYGDASLLWRRDTVTPL